MDRQLGSAGAFRPDHRKLRKGDHIYANSENPDQMLHSAAYDLGLNCLSMSHKKDTRLILVNHKVLCVKISLLHFSDVHNKAQNWY